MPSADAPAPWHLVRGDDAIVSFDEHTIPRWTRKFRIPKGYVTTRNKYMRCEKLFYSYSINAGRFLAVRATPGNWGLPTGGAVAAAGAGLRLTPAACMALFDAGAGKSDADVRALLDLAKDEPRLDVTLRACRYPHRLRQWKQLPSGLFISVTEPGVCFGAPPKEIRLAETTTVLKGESRGARRCARSSVGRSLPARRRIAGTRCSRPVLGFPTGCACTVFRTRQNEEQAFRVGVHDAFLDARRAAMTKRVRTVSVRDSTAVRCR